MLLQIEACNHNTLLLLKNPFTNGKNTL